MSIAQRKHTRFSLDIPALLVTKFGERQETLLQQISIGGCFTDWEENIYAGDEFRLEIELPNKNRLPLRCKAIYRFEDTGIGVKFLEITQFEQELISKIIARRLELEGLPMEIDAFRQPTKFVENRNELRQTDARAEKELMLEKVMSGED
jgi:hypothetical protein